MGKSRSLPEPDVVSLCAAVAQTAHAAEKPHHADYYRGAERPYDHPYKEYDHHHEHYDCGTIKGVNLGFRFQT